MARAIEVLRKLRASDGRIKIAVLSGVAVVAAAVALLVGVIPALAGSGSATTTWNVQPLEVSYGGGSGACFATIPGRLPSAATKELWINNPASGTYTGSDGTQVSLTVTNERFTFQFINSPGMAAFDVVVNGGAQNTHFDYDGNGGPGPKTMDSGLHAPTKGGGNNLYNLSHINICYDVVYKISGTKFHDRDADGGRDASLEEILSGWTVSAFKSGAKVATAMTGTDGKYELLLGAGTYTVCEKANTGGLPSNGTGFTWSWTQSYPSSGADCSGFSGYLPVGHSVTVGPDQAGIDFGNVRQVTVSCSTSSNVIVSLGGGGDPQATVTFPQNCSSTSFTTSFDVGTSDDGDNWSQFVVFGGDAGSSTVLTQTISWNPETAQYKDGSGATCQPGSPGCSLVVPTTQVRLTPTGNLVPVVFCSSASGLPNSGTPQCLNNRTIAEGAPLPAGQVKLTETYKVLGDPGNFR